MTFKSGDKVIRIGHGYGSVKSGDIVEVSRVWPEQGILSIRGDTSATYDISQFALAKLVQPTCQDPVRKPSNPKEAIGDTKLNMSVVPDSLPAYAATAFTEGALKYGSYNWRAAGVRASTYIAACRRHMAKWWNGEQCDPKTKVHHLASSIACLAIILDAELVGKLNDDRPPKADMTALIESLEGTVAHLKEMSKGLNPHHYTANDAEPR